MLIIVRHGRTATNASGRLLGRADPPLDELGVAQATAAVGAVLDAHGRPDLVVTSPLVRCRATAAGFGEDVRVDERFIELDYGDYDGVPLADVGADVWKRWRSDLDFAPPGGESLRTLGGRVRAALDGLAPIAADGTVVVVTHVSPVKAAVGWALGVGDEVTWRMFVAPASVSLVAVGEHGPSLHRFNDVSHLAGLAAAAPAG